MFLGTVSHSGRKVLSSWIPFLPKNVHVICSGNFTIETTLSMNGYQGRITGCDISLYSCALGSYFSGQPFDLQLSHSSGYYEQFRELENLARDAEWAAACVSVSMDALEFADRKNAYEERMWDAYLSQLPQIIGKTKERLREKAAKIRLDEFHCLDGWCRIDRIPKDRSHLIISFPPTYKGGYEKLYSRVESLFEWEKPEYRELTSGAEFGERITSSGIPWIIGAEEPDSELESVTGEPLGQVPRGIRKKMFFYSDLDLPTRLIRRNTTASPMPWPRLTDADNIDSQSILAIESISRTQADGLRRSYASAEIEQASSDFAYAVLIDGRVIGVLMFSRPRGSFALKNEAIEDYAYMMADIAVDSRRYPRLSKLLLYAGVSKEMRRRLERKMIQSVSHNFTTAFSRHPASMKYRGVFTLCSRQLCDDGVYRLNYCAKMGENNLKELLQKWIAKYVNK